jgi:hypothetical protein
MRTVNDAGSAVMVLDVAAEQDADWGNAFGMSGLTKDMSREGKEQNRWGRHLEKHRQGL